MNKILIELGSDSLGDTIACTPYVNKFAEDNNCEIYFSIEKPYIFLFDKSYPKINFLSRDYNISFDSKITLKTSLLKNLQLGYAEQLGYIDAPYIKPNLIIEKNERPIKNKFVTIGVHSTSQLKYWNHPLGRKVQTLQPYWDELCKRLRKKGITPVSIDRYELFGDSNNFNGIPKNSVNKTGMNLIDTINYIQHSEFYIGLSSGLSWLAHALNKRVVMISNFTESWYEFDLNDENYIRIDNKNTCNGCFNHPETQSSFDAWDWYWCPLHKDSNRQFECHTSITPEMVINKIEKWL